jgi:CRP-like cAMP-binding protein
MSDAELRRLPVIAPALRVAPGAALFDQGTVGTSCFLVVSGEIELCRTHGAETWELTTAGPGAELGLSALWDDAPRPVSAIARVESVAVEIRRSALEKLGAECPAIADRLYTRAATIAVQRLKAASTRVAEMLDPPSVQPSRETLVRLAAATAEWTAPLPRSPRRTPPNARKR